MLEPHSINSADFSPEGTKKLVTWPENQIICFISDAI